jgi:hypothetical protein
MYQN